MKKKRGTNNFTTGTNKKKKYTPPLIDPSFLSEPDIEAFKKFILEKIEISEVDTSQDTRSSTNTTPPNDTTDPRAIGTSAEAISSQLSIEESFEQQPKPFGLGLGDTNNKQPQQQTQTKTQTQKCPCPLDNPPTKPKIEYRYCNFTNSELFYFVSTLSPLELVIFYTIFAIAITMNLNLKERTILGALFVDVGFTINTMVQQEAFQGAFARDAQAAKDREAFLERQNNIAADIETLKTKLEDLTGVIVTLPSAQSTTDNDAFPTNTNTEAEIGLGAIATDDIGAISAGETTTTELSSTSSLF